MTLRLSLLVVAGVSLALTGAVHPFALSRSLLESSNALSSRLIPTRRAWSLIAMAIFQSRIHSRARFVTQDAGGGVVKRFLVVERLNEAYYSHACDAALRLSKAQLVLPMAVLVILFFSLPKMLCAELLDFDRFTAAILAYVPPVMLALRFDCGKAFF